MSYPLIITDNTYSCPSVGLTAAQWYEVLKMPDCNKYIPMLLCFLRMPNHEASCGQVAEKYGYSPSHYTRQNTQFCKFVAYKYTIEIETDSGENKYWPISMCKGYDTKNGFVWQLRDELVVALQQLLANRLLDAYKELEPFNGYKEAYKWQLLDDTENKSVLEIVRSLKGINIIDNQRVDIVFKTLSETKSNDLEACIDHLFDESSSLNDRLGNFKTEMKNLCPANWKNYANDERTAATLLTCKYPVKYTFYKDEIYQLVCQYFGYESQSVGKKYKHFTDIINQLECWIGEATQLQMSQQLTTFKNKPVNLAVQTLLWCMKDFINKEIRGNMNFTWIPFYKEFADKLMQFRNDRNSLLKLIYDNREDLMADYLHDSDKSDLKDIDPFTTFGLFNRKIKDDNRVRAINKFKDLLDIKADIPTDFVGVPILNNQRSHFFGYKEYRKKGDIENIWILFEKLQKGEDIESIFNLVKNQYSVNINITMGMYWIHPEQYLALDSTNRNYLKNEYNITLPSIAPDYKDYFNILNDIKNKMKSGVIKENTFYEISADAFTGDPSNEQDDWATWYDEKVDIWKKRKNIVLYGAPGTGKTFDVPNLAVRLCDPNFDAVKASRKEIVERYNQLKQEKRIAFTTFHQSMDYEDWMEGLRPVVNDSNQVVYQIEDGIFKQLCIEAERPIVKDKQVGIADDAVVWKVSLYGTGDNPVRTDCMKNNYIRIGWDDYGAVISDDTDWNKYNGEGKQILDAYINKMKVGDIIMSCYSNRSIDAIGVVTGDYEYVDSLPNYKRVRKVNWILKDVKEDIVALNDGKTLTLGTVYRLNSITLDKVKTILDKYKKPTSMDDNTMPYVMVIDELNRGNVSKIFGELITLLEPDKRKGMVNAESVVLPYSKKMIQVPSNVYIIATMNTADRSLGSLDYAIRRRFSFIPEKPYELDEPGFNAELFEKVSNLFVSNYIDYKESDFEHTFKLQPAETLSEDYKPEDVWIGHSYFIMQDENGDDTTSYRLLYDIIPLLEEYVKDGVLTTEAQSVIDDLYAIACK